MDAVAEGLWGLADYQEQSGEIGKAVKCLEAICQSDVSFFPIVEVKTRLRIATLLLKHSHNVNHAKAHLERAQLLLKAVPSCFDLKCRAYSLLSQCYHLVGSIAPQKQVLHKALDLTASGYDIGVKLWSCNFNSQLANALIIEGDYQSSIAALDAGYVCATQIGYLELQMFFATCMLHVHLMHWEDESSVERAVAKCDEVWEFLDPQKKQQCLGLFFYNELLHIFYRLRVCDYKNATPHIERLDAAMKADLKKTQHLQQLTKEFDAINESLSRPELHHRERLALSEKQSRIQHQMASLTTFSSTSKGTLEPAYFGNMKRTVGDKLELAPPPIDGEWLPKSAVYALVDLMMVVLSRPKGNFKDCAKRIQSGMNTIEEELLKLGIIDGVREVNLQHSAIWMAGVYLMLLMQFLENKVAMELTQSEFVEAQGTCESTIEMLRGQYAHSVGCYNEAAFHFIEAVKLTESKSMQALCQIYAAVSYICIGDSESSTQALDLIGPVYSMMDSFVGVREKTNCLFAYGLLLMKQQDLQEARNRLAKGLQMTHNQLGNLQLVSQYLTILGSLALALHDTGQAREILRSSLTLAKKLSDIPTQIWVLSVLTALYQELGEKGSEMENVEFQKSRMDALQQKLVDAHSSIHHIELIDTIKIEVQQFREVNNHRSAMGPPMSVNLDIPESVGLSAPMPGHSTTRLVDIDIGNINRRGKRKL
ncbi:sister chromatid cohesion protein SCC4 isoform X4 [Argentina anserina]|uniref:sister chromatid cohesion protein SCC4 isoform X4 n=1 Tax=Argentina anserina TaxID=57926 RepID=UPI00217636D6|nr:sister chromatid cohesion protein SCC4 isoform X4 [Potentilla anserina]